MVIGVTLATAACKDKEGECFEMQGQPCLDYGVPEEDWAAICSECDTAWYCANITQADGTTAWELRGSGYPCSCIVDGYLEVCETLPYKDCPEGFPDECISDGW